MPNSKITQPVSRQQAVDAIDRTLARFCLVLRVLDELRREAVPSPGDAEILHGCERALTGMLAALARIGAAPDTSPLEREQAIRTSLNDSKTRALVDADKLERMQQFIDAILGSPQS